MIKLIDNKLPQLPICAASVRIQSLFGSYGCKFDFLRFYEQVIEEKTVAAISIMDGQATICKIGNADFDEIIDFLRVIGVNQVFSNENLPLEKIENGTEMRKSISGGDVISGQSGQDSGGSDCLPKYSETHSDDVKLSEIYNFMSTYFAMSPFDGWYADISHRIRHGGAVAVYQSGGCATAIKCKHGALISGICVDGNGRRKGLGSHILQGIIRKSGAYHIFTLVEDGGPREFYEKNGFAPVGKFSTYKVK